MKKGVGCCKCLKRIKKQLDCPRACKVSKSHNFLQTSCGLLNKEITDLLLGRTSKLLLDLDQVKQKALEVVDKVKGVENQGNLLAICQTE